MREFHQEASMVEATADGVWNDATSQYAALEWRPCVSRWRAGIDGGSSIPVEFCDRLAADGIEEQDFRIFGRRARGDSPVLSDGDRIEEVQINRV